MHQIAREMVPAHLARHGAVVAAQVDAKFLSKEERRMMQCVLLLVAALVTWEMCARM